MFSSGGGLKVTNIVVNLMTTALTCFKGPTGVTVYVTYFIHSATKTLKLRSTRPMRCTEPRVVKVILNTFVVSVTAGRCHTATKSSAVMHFMLKVVLMVKTLMFLKYPLHVIVHVSTKSLGT